MWTGERTTWPGEWASSKDVRDLRQGRVRRVAPRLRHHVEQGAGASNGRCWAIDDPACLEYLSTAGDWPGLRSVVMECRRETDTGTTVHARYSSSMEASAKRQLEAVRAHWSIENSLHWSMCNLPGGSMQGAKGSSMATLQISHNLPDAVDGHHMDTTTRVSPCLSRESSECQPHRLLVPEVPETPTSSYM